MACLLSQLPKELALRSAIPFTKGMNCVDLSQVEPGAPCEMVDRLTSKKVFRCQLPQQFLYRLCDELSSPEHRSALGDVYRSELSSPRKDILEEKAVRSF